MVFGAKDRACSTILGIGFLLLVGLFLNPDAKAQGFPASLELSDLDGSNGLALERNGVAITPLPSFDFPAQSADIGDINGDGVADFAFGLNSADAVASANTQVGAVFVIFGRKGGLANPLELSALDGSNGFVLYGDEAGDTAGDAVSAAGDINNDGVDDLIIGAPFANPGGRSAAGISYVVFGKTTAFAPVIELGLLNGTDGFAILGALAFDASGLAVSAAGDINSDGIDDVIIGAPNATSGSNIRAGISYVILGHSMPFAAELELSSLPISAGFSILGETAEGFTGAAVSSAGDINDDGVTDVIIGSSHPRVSNLTSYVVFGNKDGFSASVALSMLNGKNGFAMTGTSSGESFGFSVNAAGDVNQDGLDDIIVGAPEGDVAYVVFGAPDFSFTLAMSSLDGSNGFKINRATEGDQLGFSVDGAGDVNGDGVDDLIAGAPHADPEGQSHAGSAYVIFGKTTAFDPVFELSALDVTNGLVINGIAADDLIGRMVSRVGDFNSDGVDDLFVGSEASVFAGSLIYGLSHQSGPSTLFSAILPAARSGYVGGPDITVFSSVINATANRADNCQFSVPGDAPVRLNFQATNSLNASVGPADASFSINPGATKSFILAFEPRVVSNGEDIFPNVFCDAASIAPIVGVNTVFISIDTVEVPDILSISATPDANGIITVPATGISFMSVSATNIGVGDVGGSSDATVSVSVDDGEAGLPLILQICETNALGACLNPPGAGPITTIIDNGPSFFAVFVSDQASGGIPLDPANSRVFLRFTDSSGIVRSVTSAAVTVP